ncbi:MAG: cysteine synthase family protein [Acidobacteriota bacterium]
MSSSPQPRLRLATDSLLESIRTGVLNEIGHTPLLPLTRLGDEDRRGRVLAKLECDNPGGSVKDRTAWGLVRAAREDGRLEPGQALVEPTAGNTGIGLALVASALGHPLTVVMPARYSAEKIELCAALGAQVVTLPGDHVTMEHCREEAYRRAELLDGLVLDQFNNPANPGIHETTTGPEILEQVDGPIDAVVLGVGTGGTFTGVVRALRKVHPELRTVAVENRASVLSGLTPSPSLLEGIGSRFWPKTLDQTLIDSIVRVDDEDALACCALLARREGLLPGGSGGAAVHAALEVARELGPGSTVVTLIADRGERYLSQERFREAVGRSTT